MKTLSRVIVVLAISFTAAACGQSIVGPDYVPDPNTYVPDPNTYVPDPNTYVPDPNTYVPDPNT